MDQYFDAVTSAADRQEIDRWCEANSSGEVGYIVIDKPTVLVHGRNRDLVGVSGKVGRLGKLTAELDAALVAMRNAIAL